MSALHFPFRDNDEHDYRLPRALVPTHYDLQLRPDFYGANATQHNHRGRVRIYLTCRRTTDRLVLHAVGLDVNAERTLFQEIHADDARVNKTIALRWQADAERHFLVGNLSQAARAGRAYTLELEFSAPLVEKKAGIYFRRYTTENNATE